MPLEPSIEETTALLAPLGETAIAEHKDSEISHELWKFGAQGLKLAGLFSCLGIAAGLVTLLARPAGTLNVASTLELEEVSARCRNFDCPEGFSRARGNKAADNLAACCEEALCTCLHPFRSNRFTCNLPVKDSACGFGADCVNVDPWPYTGRATACQQRVRSDLYNPADESLKRPSKAPLLSFYLYRAEGVGQAPVENINAGNAAGMLFFLHNELRTWSNVEEEGVRIRRLKVQVRNTQPLFSLGYHFSPRMNMDYGKCFGLWLGPLGNMQPQSCAPVFRTYGYSVGCSRAGDFSDSAYPDHPLWRPYYTSEDMYQNATGYNACRGGALWYSFVGSCSEEKFSSPDKDLQECIGRSPGGRCYGTPTGEGDCTYSMEDAGHILVHDLVEAWAKEQREEAERFWNRDDLKDGAACQKKVDLLLNLFNERYGEEAMLEPFCDFNPLQPLWSADMIVSSFGWGPEPSEARRLGREQARHLQDLSPWPLASREGLFGKAEEEKLLESTKDLVLRGPELYKAIAQRRESIRQRFSKELASPSAAPLLTFYAYTVDARCNEAWLENSIAGDAAGVMFYIHDRLVDGYGQLRDVCIRRFKVQVRATAPLSKRGLSFGLRLHAKEGLCQGPNFGGLLEHLPCSNIFKQYGFFVGCGAVGDFPDANLSPGTAPCSDVSASQGYVYDGQRPTWYTFPGRLVEVTSREVITAQGGLCIGEPTGTGSCTYSSQPAGFVFLRDLVRPHGSAFWHKKLDPAAGRHRVEKLLSMFKASFGEEVLSPPVCDFDASKPFFSTYIFGY